MLARGASFYNACDVACHEEKRNLFILFVNSKCRYFTLQINGAEDELKFNGTRLSLNT